MLQLMEIRRIISNYYKQLYSSKTHNGQILRKVPPSRLSQEGMEDMNRPITSIEISTEIETVT